MPEVCITPLTPCCRALSAFGTIYPLCVKETTKMNKISQNWKPQKQNKSEKTLGMKATLSLPTNGYYVMSVIS